MSYQNEGNFCRTLHNLRAIVPRSARKYYADDGRYGVNAKDRSVVGGGHDNTVDWLSALNCG
jgi:hypothetical protein